MNINLRQPSGLICAFRIERNGMASPLDVEALSQQETNGGGWTWAHFDVASLQTKQWFDSQNEIEPHVVEALLSAETRPRATRFASGTLIILRGVNLRPASALTDMISIRLWVEKNRIISTRVQRFLSIRRKTDRHNPAFISLLRHQQR